MSPQTRPPALALALACGALLASCTSPRLLIEANEGNLRTARTVATAFYHEHGARAGLRDIPFVTVGMDAGTGFEYDADHNVLFLTPYEYADFDTQKFFTRASLGGSGKDAYNALLFEFFTAHQLMHLLYEALPLPAVAEYEEERHINAMTWLFLRRQGLDPEREAAWLTTVANLEGDLGRRFPGASGDADLVAALAVVDNPSYWFVTADLLQRSYREAADYASEGAYITELLLPSDEAQAAR